MSTETITVKSSRIFLKEIDISDIDETFMSWFSNEDLMRYYTNSKKEITKSDIIEYITNGKITKTSYTYGIYDLENSKCIGTIKIGPINNSHKISDLVVLIGDTNYHGKGIATEAIKIGTKLAFDFYGIRKLFGGMYETNISSIKAYTNAGWVIEGKLKGHYLENDKPIDRVLVGCFNPTFFYDLPHSEEHK